MSELVTTGVWHVKAGHEAQFVEEWTQFTRDAASYPGAGTLHLGRDTGDPSRFVSFALWSDAPSAHAWKSNPAFGERMARVQQHVDRFEPSELDLVAAVGAGDAVARQA